MAPRPVLLAAAAALLALMFHVSRRSPPSDDEDEEEVLRLGLVLGSERRGGNTVGMGTYLSALVPTLPLPSSPPLVLDVVDLAALNLPRTFTHAPAKPRPAPSGLARWSPFASPDAAWSARVRSWDAVLFVTPEYNGHVPGILKSALDRLYAEWHSMPAGLVAHGYEGGGRVLERGKALFGEMGMEVVGGVGVVTGGRRVTGAEEWLGQETKQEGTETMAPSGVDEQEHRDGETGPPHGECGPEEDKIKGKEAKSDPDVKGEQADGKIARKDRSTEDGGSGGEPRKNEVKGKRAARPRRAHVPMAGPSLSGADGENGVRVRPRSRSLGGVPMERTKASRGYPRSLAAPPPPSGNGAHPPRPSLRRNPRL